MAFKVVKDHITEKCLHVLDKTCPGKYRSLTGKYLCYPTENKSKDKQVDRYKEIEDLKAKKLEDLYECRLFDDDGILYFTVICDEDSLNDFEAQDAFMNSYGVTHTLYRKLGTDDKWEQL